MSDIHREVFELFQKGADRGVPVRELRAELQDHLAGCTECRMDIDIYQGLREEAALLWPVTLEPRRSAVEMLAAIRVEMDREQRRQMVLRPLRVAAWVALAILLVLGVNWIVASLRPQPAATPAPTEVEEAVPPLEDSTPTPEAGQPEFSKFPVEPFAAGAGTMGDGLWSPDSRWFFFGLLEAGEDPLSDRRVTTLHFLDPASGEVCRQEQEFLGPATSSGQARWLPDGRLLLVSEDEGAQLLEPCGEILDLDDLFTEAIHSLPAREDPGRYILLQGESRYWLLEREMLSAWPLEGQIHTEVTRLDWSPSGEQLAIYQPDSGDQPTGGTIALVEAESGEVARTINLPIAGEMGVIEWLLEDKIFLWIFSERGPVLLDLSGDEPNVIFVLPEWFGLELPFPDEFSSSSSVADETAGNLHIAFKVNTAADKTTYLYHSESGEVERLPVEGHTFLIFPDGDFEPLFLAEDRSSNTDEIDLVWVDDAEKGIQHLSVAGHTPRDYPILWPRLAPNGEQIAFASSQGVSLVSIPDGQLLGFWSLEGPAEPNQPMISPDGRFMVVSGQKHEAGQGPSGGAFYLIPLEP